MINSHLERPRRGRCNAARLGHLLGPAALGLSFLVIIPGRSDTTKESNWPQWRGPNGTGVAPHADPPTHWSEQKNVRWKLGVPGKGHSTPIIWGNRVYLTTAVPHGDRLPARYSNSDGAHDLDPVTHSFRFVVLAIDRRDGSILWQHAVHDEIPHEGAHRTSSMASPSPVTDGEHLFAYFGSQGLYCLDLEGTVLWNTDLGQMRPLHSHGEGSSPTLHEDAVLVQWDHEGPSFLAAFDKDTGATRWKVPREELSSWSTPIVAEVNGRTQVIAAGAKRVKGYDFATGKVLWECGWLSEENVVATPVAGHGMAYAGSTYDRTVVMGIPLDGNTGGRQPAWIRTRGAPYVPSFLLYDKALYYHHHFQGILTRVNAVTGEYRPGAIRLEGLRSVFSSPIGAAGRIYATDVNGSTIVLSHADKPEVLAVNKLNDRFSASPAAAGRELYLRGERHLYCIAED